MKKLFIIMAFMAITIAVFSQNEGIRRKNLEATQRLTAVNEFYWNGFLMKQDSLAYIQVQGDSIRIFRVDGSFSGWIGGAKIQTELDPVFTAWDKSTGITITKSQVSDFGSYEPVFTKNTGFNKNFGTTAGTVAQGDDSRIVNGQSAFTWGNHALAGYLTAISESDPLYSAWDKSTGITITKSQVSDFGSYEPVFTKNTAFNKNFGTTAGTVAQGDDSRIVNGQSAFAWGNHALSGYAPLASPALTGSPTAPTASGATNNTQIATTAFVKTAIAAIPGTDLTNITFEDTYNSNLDGIIYKGVNLWLHNYEQTGTTGDNTFLGESAGNLSMGMNTGTHEGSANTGIGTEALSSNRYGWANTAVGRNALMDNTDGFENTAFGRGALIHNTNGQGNTALGKDAVYNNLTGDTIIGIGHNAFFSSTTGHSNIGIGEDVGYKLNSSYNTMIGYKAGNNVTTGGSNLYLGYRTGDANVSGSHQLLIGNGVDATTSYAFNIGNILTGDLSGSRSLTLNAATVYGPTPTAGDNSTKIATTAFVQSAMAGGYGEDILMVGSSPSLVWTETDAPADEKTFKWISAAGNLYFETWNDAGAKKDGIFYVINGPTSVESMTFNDMPVEFEGVVTGLTPTIGDNSTKFATTEFVANSLGSGIGEDILMSGLSPSLTWTDTDAPANEKTFKWITANGDMFFEAWTDAGAKKDGIFYVTNGPSSIESMTFNDMPVTFQGITYGLTATAGDNSTKLATTAFVANAISGLGGVGDNITLNHTTSSDKTGILYKGGTTAPTNLWLHNYADGGSWGGNTFLGQAAGNLTMAYVGGTHEASANTGVGKDVLQDLTTGWANTAVGWQSGMNITTGHENTSLGRGSLYSLSTGFLNTALGKDALYAITSGNYNIGIGHNTFYSNSTASNNVGIGEDVGYHTTTGNNTFVGHKTGFSQTTGTGNTYLGYMAGYGNITGDNQIVIGHDIDAKSVSGDNQINIGNLYTGNSATGFASIGVGAAGIDYTLEFDGESNNGMIKYWEDEDQVQYYDRSLFDKGILLAEYTAANPGIGSNYGLLRASSDGKIYYVNDAGTTYDLTGTTAESDPIFAAWNKSTGISITKSQVSDFGSYEPVFTKNTGFNKNFGTTTGTVAQGDDSRILNGQTAFTWGNHASAGYSLTSHNHTGVYEPVFTKNTAFNKNFGTTTGTVAQGNDTRIANGQTAYDWGDHHMAGYSLFSHDHTGIYEPVFTKNDAFNKIFGTTTGTVAQGDDSRILNGQTAFTWGNHASAGYAALSSPTFTGIPRVPTAAPGVSTTQIASTEFVMTNAEGYLGTPSLNGQILSSNTDGSRSWITVSPSGGSPGGSDGEMQYRVNSTTFGGMTGFLFNGTDISVTTGKKIRFGASTVADIWSDNTDLRIDVTGRVVIQTQAGSLPLFSMGTSGNTSNYDLTVPAETYGTGWNGSNEAPTKNDVFDKIESVVASGGGITSVGLTAPTGFTVTNSPLIANGVIGLTFTSGYSLPTTANQTSWSTAYGWGNHASAGYAALASPALTGTPTAPTATASTNSTQIATTAFVANKYATQALTYSASITMDTNSGPNASITLTGNCALTITNLQDGMSGTVAVTQDATGSRTITVAGSTGYTTVKWRAGESTLSTAGSSVDLISYKRIGSILFCTLGTNWN